MLIEGKRIKEKELQNSKYPKNHENLVKITSIAIHEVPKRQVIRPACIQCFSSGKLDHKQAIL